MNKFNKKEIELIKTQAAAINILNTGKPLKIIAWWSGGVTSAVACWFIIKLYGLENIRFVFIDTKNESEDTYRFKRDCEKWYGKEIESISSTKYNNIKEVWYHFKSLNVANGAICSSELKRAVRLEFQKNNEFDHQVFGYDTSEPNRAVAMTTNYPDAKSIYPLLFYTISKPASVKICEEAGIKVPESYYKGFNNNNCEKTGCVQGGIGYWQLKRITDPGVFENMAFIEHDLTNLKGKPVTMLRDQSKGGGLVFLKPHPDYPNIKDLSMMKGRPPKPLIECNGYCGTKELMNEKERKEYKEVYEEINFETDG